MPLEDERLVIQDALNDSDAAPDLIPKTLAKHLIGASNFNWFRTVYHT
jgi:hypothetical protein